MQSTFRKSVNLSFSMIAVIGMSLLGISEGWGQEKRKISYRWPAGNSRYLQQHAIDVGDVPNHQIRIYEIQRSWPANPPIFEGVRVKEEKGGAFSDYTDGNGRTWGYYIYLLESGDRIFARIDGTSRSDANPDGTKKNVLNAVITITSGTGKFRGIRGTARYQTGFDLQSSPYEGQVEGEYWMEK